MGIIKILAHQAFKEDPNLKVVLSSVTQEYSQSEDLQKRPLPKGAVLTYNGLHSEFGFVRAYKLLDINVSKLLIDSQSISSILYPQRRS